MNFNQPLADFRQHDAALSARKSDDHSIDAHLYRQYQSSESTAVKRTYGFSLFGKSQWNTALDALMYEVYRLKKGVLKLTTPWETK